MNQTIENIISRRSVKKYTDQQVPLELVEEVVKAGMYAPSGMNSITLSEPPVDIKIKRLKI